MLPSGEEPPSDLFDRTREWADLASFVEDGTGRLGIGVVYGRRRVGKTHLLRALCHAYGGFYHVALEQAQLPALTRFARDLATYVGLTAPLRLDSWEQAFGAAVSEVARRRRGRPSVLVIDELPYLLAHSPEIPSVLQALYDESARAEPSRLRIVLCGSALSVMSELLAGARALRGRASLDMVVGPFNYRVAAGFWGIRDHDTAFRLDALVGGSPGYRDVAGPPPQTAAEVGAWATATLMNPSHALYREDEYLLREDPRIANKAMYFSILTAIAGGSRTPTEIGRVIGRSATALPAPLETLRRCGFVRVEPDLLHQRRPVYTLADPAVRALRLLVRPFEPELERREAASIWASLEATRSSQIIGPHFELIAREWVRHFAGPTTLGGRVGAVGRATLTDRASHSMHDIDVLVLDHGERPQNPGSRLLALGEAKSSARQRDLRDLARLDRIRGLLLSRGHDCTQAKLHIFGRGGFSADLRAAVGRRTDVELIDLARLYEGE